MISFDNSEFVKLNSYKFALSNRYKIFHRINNILYSNFNSNKYLFKISLNPSGQNSLFLILFHEFLIIFFFQIFLRNI